MAAALEAGDPVAAQGEAAELLAAVDSALARGDVPRRLAREVRRGAERLAALVDAAQPPPPAPPPVEEDDDADEERGEEGENGKGDSGPGKGRGNDKERDKDDERDDE